MNNDVTWVCQRQLRLVKVGSAVRSTHKTCFYEPARNVLNVLSVGRRKISVGGPVTGSVCCIDSRRGGGDAGSQQHGARE